MTFLPSLPGSSCRADLELRKHNKARLCCCLSSPTRIPPPPSSSSPPSPRAYQILPPSPLCWVWVQYCQLERGVISKFRALRHTHTHIHTAFFGECFFFCGCGGTCWLPHSKTRVHSFWVGGRDCGCAREQGEEGCCWDVKTRLAECVSWTGAFLKNSLAPFFYTLAAWPSERESCRPPKNVNRR